MHHIEGCDRSQAQLLPARVDDYVDRDNPVRFIDAFVDDLDLNGAGFARVEPKDTGRPAYDPADLLKLYIYGYVNRVRSSRRLEIEARRNLEAIWLLCGLRPDFKTIADFRKDNRNAFKAVFRQFVLLCRKLDLFGRELVAVDGTRLKAVNSTDRNFTREKLKKLIQWADERLADYLARLDRTDGEEGTASSVPAKNLAEKIATLKQRRGRYAELSQELERTGEKQISLTDPDSRAMASYPKVGVGYNAQVAVDAKHKLIVAQEVTNAGSDLGLLAQTAGAAKEVLGVERIDAVADKGYYKGEDIQACEEAGIDAYVAHPQRGSAVSNGLFRKEEFATTRAATPICVPADSVSSPATTPRSRGTHWSITATLVPVGPARSSRVAPQTPIDGSAVGPMRRCSTAWPNVWRRDPRYSGCGARPSSTRFGSIKQWMNQGYFLMRGLEKVRAEFSLTALAYNFTRAVKLSGSRRCWLPSKDCRKLNRSPPDRTRTAA